MQWVVMLSQEAQSTQQHWREAFEALIQNANRGPGAAAFAASLGV